MGVIIVINNYILLSYGRVYNPYQWFYNPSYVVNRVYYIVSGTAFYKNDTALKPGHLYVFNAFPDFRVKQSDEDPVDHVFFDFQTYGKLVKEDFLEVKVDEYPRLKHIVNAASEDFFINHVIPELPRIILRLLCIILRIVLSLTGIIQR